MSCSLAEISGVQTKALSLFQHLISPCVVELSQSVDINDQPVIIGLHLALVSFFFLLLRYRRMSQVEVPVPFQTFVLFLFQGFLFSQELTKSYNILTFLCVISPVNDCRIIDIELAEEFLLQGVLLEGAQIQLMLLHPFSNRHSALFFVSSLLFLCNLGKILYWLNLRLEVF